MRIRLDKDLVLRLYCCFCQASRSVHRGHASCWSGLRDYYRGERTRIVQQLLRRLQEALAPVQGDKHPTDRDEAMRHTPNQGLLRVFLGPMINQWKTSWRFAVSEIRFMVLVLHRLLDALESPAKPDADKLIALRMDLNACTWPIENRCYGLAELNRGRRIEHYDRTEWVAHLQLWEILGEQAPPVPGGPSAKAG